MNKRAYSFAVLIVGISSFFIYLSFNQDNNTQIQPISLEDNSGEVRSKTVELDSEIYRLPKKINTRGLNLIFFADQYFSWEEFENDVNVLMEEAKKIEPWKSYSLYNIYKIYDKESAGVCYIKVQNERKPVLRCREKINEYLNNIPLERFKLIVLSRNDFQSWANVVRLENSGIFFSISQALMSSADRNSYGILFSHLLGHSFGLKDEELIVLTKYNTAVLAPDGPNCAPNKITAEKWWGELAKEYPNRVGYFSGCSGDERYIKPTKSSLMSLNDLSDFDSDYGPVSELYLNKVLKYCFNPERYSIKDDLMFFNRYPAFTECLE